MTNTMAVQWELTQDLPEYCLRFILYKKPKNGKSAFNVLALAGGNNFPMPPRFPAPSFDSVPLIMIIMLLQFVVLHTR